MQENDDITEFVLSKIQSLCAETNEEDIEGKREREITMIERSIAVFFRRFRIGKIQECHKKILQHLQHAQRRKTCHLFVFSH